MVRRILPLVAPGDVGLGDAGRGGGEQHLGIGLVDRLVEADLALHPAGALDPLGGDEGDDDTGAPGPGGAARAVDVRLVVLGRVEVEDRRHVVDVDAPGGDVGGDEGVDTAAGEVGEGTSALRLAAAAVDRGGADAGLAELPGEPVRAVAGPAEDDGRPGRADGLGEHAAAGGAVHLPEQVSGSGDVRRLVAHLVADRIPLVVAGEMGDVAVEGRREQHGLAVGGGLLEEPADHREEAHVGHAVGLVDDDPVDGTKVNEALADQVLEAAGAGHEDIDALAEGGDLGSVADAAVDDADPDGPGEGAEFVMDLFRELPGRSQDEAPRETRLGAFDGGDEWDSEGERLAGAGRGPAADVAPGEGVGDGGRLDGEGLGDAAGLEGAADPLGDAQSGEGAGGAVGHGSPRPRVGRFRGFMKPRRVCGGRC